MTSGYIMCVTYKTHRFAKAYKLGVIILKLFNVLAQGLPAKK